MIDFYIITVHLSFAIGLYYIMNWIGEHSYSIGYSNIAVVSRYESDAIAFNYLVRVLGPIVYLIIISSILYHFKLNVFVADIYKVNIYYIALRLLYSLTEYRRYLVNWPKQFLYFISIAVFSIITYNSFITKKTNLLPDFSNVTNEIWIIIMVFLYQLFDKIKLNSGKAEMRREKYIKLRYRHLKKDFGKIIHNSLHKPQLEILAYAILIHEDFNRPKSIRLLERVSFYVTRKPHSLGIMQVSSNKMINDNESVKLGVNKLKHDYEIVIATLKEAHKKGEDLEYGGYRYGESSIQIEIINQYNGGINYSSAVTGISILLEKWFYPNNTDRLTPLSWD